MKGFLGFWLTISLGEDTCFNQFGVPVHLRELIQQLKTFLDWNAWIVEKSIGLHDDKLALLISCFIQQAFIVLHEGHHCRWWIFFQTINELRVDDGSDTSWSALEILLPE